jgi:hypothetical protein
MLGHLLRPARGGAIAVVIVFALLLSIASRAGLFGLPLTLLISSWFFKYCYILFDHVSRGFDDPPVLDIKWLNPVDEQRPLGQVCIVALLIGAVVLTKIYLGALPAVLLAIVCLLFLPASIAILGLEGHLLKAAYPVAWFKMVFGLGPLYVMVLALIFLECLLLYALGRLNLWLSVRTAVGMFGTLSVFSLLGGAIYERRDELGVETWVSPEQTAARERQEELKEDQDLVTEAYGLLRAREHVKSWNMLQGWLERHARNPDAYLWLCDRVERWEDPRYITRLTEERVERLLVLKRAGEALDVVAARLRLDGTFRPKTAADTLSLAQLAARGGGKPTVARTLLSDFATRFAGDPRVPIAAELKRHLHP